MECKNFPNCDTDFSKRIAALEAELAEAKRVTFDPAVLEDMNRLEAENAELRKDAERYRWLRSLWKVDHFSTELQPDGDSHSCDAAIDAAMKEAQS